MSKKSSKLNENTSNNNGQDTLHKENILSKEELTKVFRTMYLARQTDLKALSLLKQGKTFFSYSRVRS